MAVAALLRCVPGIKGWSLVETKPFHQHTLSSVRKYFNKYPPHNSVCALSFIRHSVPLHCLGPDPFAMPGLHASSRTVVIQHDSASDFLAAAYPTLRRHEASSNIVLAHALKRVSAEAALSGYQFICDADVEAFLATAEPSSFIPHRNGDSLWLTLWNMAPSSPPTLDLVLSCVNWTLGEYPIFLWTPRRPSSLSSEWLMPRINQLAEHLQSCVPPERVFSVFGTTPLVKAFARCWTDMTGFTVEPEPFYAAYFSYCTLETFKDCDALLPEGHALRRATMRDLECVAGLCKEFADDSVRDGHHSSTSRADDSAAMFRFSFLCPLREPVLKHVS